MSIFENKLVRTYFGRGSYEEYKPDGYQKSNEWIALSLIDAMEQPIKKGERILVISSSDGSIREEIAARDCSLIHPFDLRLPDRFQKKECDCLDHSSCQCVCHKPAPEPEKCGCGCGRPDGCHVCIEKHEASSALEEKIKAFAYKWSCCVSSPFKQSGPVIEYFDKELRVLVKLVKESK